MKPSWSAFTVATLLAGSAVAGGLYIPGDGAVSTSRAGASVAATDDGEAIAINPAGIAKAKGTTVTIGIAALDYFMSFKRNGTYDRITELDAMGQPQPSYVGQAYPKMTNQVDPPLGIGSFQPVPVLAIVSDLGGAVTGLHVAAGVYAPNAYPFRDMTNVNGQKFVFNSGSSVPPPPTRYDILQQQATVILPSIVVAYSLPNIPIDIGARFSAGLASLKSSTVLWGIPANYDEWVENDGMFTVNASDNFVPQFAAGATYRPTPQLEFGANYTSEFDINAKGTAVSANGPAVSVGGQPVTIGPPADSLARCAPGGTSAALKACISLALPMNAQVGGRYKFLGPDGKLKGDIELDLDWENWGANSVSNYTVVVDGVINQALSLKDSVIEHGLQDTYGVRLGGSYIIPAGGHDLILRGGVAYDTAAAKPGWERADLDGAARTTLAAGVGYKMKRIEIDAGFGGVLEGTRTDDRTCNPTAADQGCGGTPGYPASPTGTDLPQNEQKGPNPVNPLIDSTHQAESPVNEGTYKSHYLMFMLGASFFF